MTVLVVVFAQVPPRFFLPIETGYGFLALLVAASVLGLQCPLGLAQRLAEIEDPLTALEGAMSARLLEPRDLESEHDIAFPHALTRAAVGANGVVSDGRRIDASDGADSLVHGRRGPGAARS